MQHLRSQALFADAGSIGIQTTPDAAWAVVMDSAHDAGSISVVSLIDGSTSIYFSRGGGVIGAGAHARVARASVAFVRAADAVLDRFTPAASTAHPPPGLTRFLLRTGSALLAADARELDLGAGAHPLSPLFHAGQNVITAVREQFETAGAAESRPRAVESR
jgi:hypothetical protein